MPGFWLWQGFEYVNVTQGYKCHNMAGFTIIGRVLNVSHKT